MTILFVSHKLEEVEQLCDRAIVLRQGKLIGAMDPPFNTKALVEMMFGKEIELEYRAKLSIGQKVLHAKSICLEGTRIKYKGVDLEVRAGEVIGSCRYGRFWPDYVS